MQKKSHWGDGQFSHLNYIFSSWNFYKNQALGVTGCEGAVAMEELAAVSTQIHPGRKKAERSLNGGRIGTADGKRHLLLLFITSCWCHI